MPFDLAAFSGDGHRGAGLYAAPPAAGIRRTRQQRLSLQELRRSWRRFTRVRTGSMKTIAMHAQTPLWVVPCALPGGVPSALTASLLLPFPDRIRTTLWPGPGGAVRAAFPESAARGDPCAGPERVRGQGLGPALGVPGFFLLEKRIFRYHSHSGEGRNLRIRG